MIRKLTLLFVKVKQVLGSKVSNGDRINRDSSQLRAHAEKLAANAHDCNADDLKKPPRQGSRKSAVVDPTAEEV
jgi:hypothetical protein